MLKQRAVTVFSLYPQAASPYPRKPGMEVRDFSRVRLHRNFLRNLLCFSDEQITLISQLHPGSGVLVRDGYVSLF